MWYAYFNTKYFVMQEILTLIVQFAQKNVSKKSVAAIFVAFSFVFQEISRCNKRYILRKRAYPWCQIFVGVA